jgi:hypothetical protein
MRRVSKYIYLSLTIFFIISAISLLLAWLGGEGSIFGNFFNGVSFYGALIGVFLVLIHIVILILSFIVKNLKYIYLLLKYTFIISAISFLVAWLGGEASFVGDVFSGISFYGTLICMYLFFIHLVGFILSSVLKNNSKT